jgi:hypothetical protein
MALVQNGVGPFWFCAERQSVSDWQGTPQTEAHVGHCVTQL